MARHQDEHDPFDYPTTQVQDQKRRSDSYAASTLGEDVSLSALSVDCLHEEEEFHFVDDDVKCVEAFETLVLGHDCVFVGCFSRALV